MLFFCMHCIAANPMKSSLSDFWISEFSWSSMQKLKDPATQNLMYPTLCRLAKHVDLIPHSNAYCETLFSMVKKNLPNVDSIDWYLQNSAHMQCLPTLRLNNLFRECRATIAGILFSCLKGLSKQHVK
jgi:hypothetical protein